MQIIEKKYNCAVFDKIYWLGMVRAKAKDDYNLPLQHMEIGDKRAVCTDGKRLHIIKSDLGLKHGLYKFDRVTKSVIQIELSKETFKFPDSKGILETARSLDYEEGTINTTFTGDTFEVLEDVLAVLKITGHDIDPKYFNDTLSAMKVFTIFVPGGHKAVHFVCDDYEALVMPRINQHKEEVKDGKPESTNDKKRSRADRKRARKRSARNRDKSRV